MFKTKDKADFIKAQQSEIEGLEEMNVFAYIKNNMLPDDAKLLRAVWSYRRKRRPDGTLLKHKARLCADGSQQEKGIDYEESFAPVVSWSTVCMSLILATLLDLEMRQIDFVQAFHKQIVRKICTCRCRLAGILKTKTATQNTSLSLRKNYTVQSPDPEIGSII